MKIDSGTVGMASSRSYHSTAVSMRRFTIWKGTAMRGGLSGGQGALDTALGGGSADAWGTAGADGKNARTGAGQSATLQDWQGRLQSRSSNVAVRNSASDTLANIRQTTIRYIYDILFSARRNRLGQWGQNRAMTPYESLTQQNGSGAMDAQNGNASSGAQNADGTGGLVQDGLQGLSFGNIANMRVLSYVNETIKVESEETSFSTVGKVRTADGREIEFNVNVGMSRTVQERYMESLQLGFTMCDPLVINLDTDIASLSDQTFYFDIDADGELDEISQLGPGSGYLALDKNGDGQINDGSELFGTASGNGFADLAQYDEDGNGWIDENDAVWEKLKIWCKDEDGNDVLYRLADKGVGAICLQNVSTDFTLKGNSGQTQGAIRNSGIFLYENGAAGTVQHVDVAKYQAQA